MNQYLTFLVYSTKYIVSFGFLTCSFTLNIGSACTYVLVWLWMLLGFISFPEKLVSADTIIYHWMDELCGRQLDMENEGVYIAFIKFSGAAETRKCSLTISPGYYWNKLSFQITEYSNGGDSCLSFSEKLIGSEEPRGIPGLIGDYCNYAKPPLKRQFTVDKLAVNFTPHSIQFYFYMAFEIVVTVFRDDGECSHYQCDNNRCIPNDLQCNAYNPCGDGSDCPKSTKNRELSLLKVVGIVIGVTIGSVLGMCVVKRCLSSSSEDTVDRESDPRDSPTDLENQQLYTNRERSEISTYCTNDQRTQRTENINSNCGTPVCTDTRGSRSVPALNLIEASDASDRPPYETDEIELFVTDVQEPMRSSAEVSDYMYDITGNTPEIPPPPSYDSVMAHEEMYKVSQ